MTEKPPRAGRKSPTTYEDVYLAVEMLTKSLNRGVTIGEIASVVFPNHQALSFKSKEYESVYHMVKTHPDLVEMGRMRDKGTKILFGIGRRTPAPDTTIPNNGGKRPPASPPQGLPSVPSDELRSHLAKVIEGLETLQEHIGPALALLLDLDRDYDRFVTVRGKLASLKNQIDGISL